MYLVWFVAVDGFHRIAWFTKFAVQVGILSVNQYPRTVAAIVLSSSLPLNQEDHPTDVVAVFGRVVVRGGCYRHTLKYHGVASFHDGSIGRQHYTSTRVIHQDVVGRYSFSVFRVLVVIHSVGTERRGAVSYHCGVDKDPPLNRV